MKLNRKNGRSEESNGAAKAGSISPRDLAPFKPGTQQRTVDIVIDERPDGKANGNGNGNGNGDGHSSGNGKGNGAEEFISVLMAQVKERDARIGSLEEQFAQNKKERDLQARELEERFARKVKDRDEKVTELEMRLAAQAKEHADKVAEIEERFEAQRAAMQPGIGPRTGVEVSTILHAAEAAAEQLVEQARATAEQLTSQAEAAAQDLVKKADASARQVRSKADAEAASFTKKMQQVVGDVELAHKTLGELAASLAHLEGKRAVKAPVAATTPEPAPGTKTSAQDIGA